MSSEINIEKIMEEIRQEIRERGYQLSDIKFEDIPVEPENLGTNREEFSREDFQKSLDYINAKWEIPFYFPIGNSGLKTFIKRIIRKSVKFLLYPINQEQNEMNAAFTRSINQIRNYIDSEISLNVQMDNLEYEFNRQVKKDFVQLQNDFLHQCEIQADIRKTFSCMQKQLEQLNHENQILKEKLEILTLKCEKLEIKAKL